MLTAQRFVQTILGKDYVAFHFRRHGWLKFWKAVPLVQRPARNSAEKWDGLLYRHGLDGDSQEIRPLLVKAHEELLLAKEVLDVMCELNCEPEGWQGCIDLNSREMKEEVSLVELGKVWQAQLYEIALRFSGGNREIEQDGDSATDEHYDPRLLPLFNNLVSNETDDDAVAEFLTHEYILPKRSCFYMLMRIVDSVL